MPVSIPSDEQADPAPRPTRRVFNPEYKLAMVAEYENAPNGEKGAILRREGVAIQPGVAAGGSQAPVVNSWVRTAKLSRPHLVAVDR